MNPGDELLIRILVRLRARSGEAIATAGTLATAFEVSTAQVASALAELQALGYVIYTETDGVLTLISSPDRVIDTEVLAGLDTALFASQLHCYGRIRSTNLRARELAEAGAPDGTIVVAEEQIGGMGRMGRTWHSASGLGIWSSVVLRPPGPLERASGLSLLAALVFAETAGEELGLRVDLKWPNDGLIKGRKVLGVLTELSTESGQVEYAICGTGINVSHQPEDFPEELRDTATSLSISCGRPVERMPFYRAFLRRFDGYYLQFRDDGITPFLPEYRRRSVLLGQEVSIRQGKQTITGTAVAVNDAGALIVRSGGRDTVVYSGEATLRPQ